MQDKTLCGPIIEQAHEHKGALMVLMMVKVKICTIKYNFFLITIFMFIAFFRVSNPG